MPEAAAHRLQQTVDEITGYSRRTRKLVRGMIAVTVACVVVAAFAVFLYFRQHNNALNNCLAGNQTRSQSEQLWNTLFTLAAKNSTGKPTPQAQKLTTEFLHDVQVTYAPVNCNTRFSFW